MASGIVEPQGTEKSLQVQGSSLSGLVQHLLMAADSLPEFIKGLLKTQAITVAGTEAAAFLVEIQKDQAEPSLRLIEHIRTDNSSAETRAAAVAAFQEIIKPVLAQGKDGGAIELQTGEGGIGIEPQFCLVTPLRREALIVGVTAVITRCKDLGRARQRLLSMQLVAGYFDLYTLRRQSEQSQIVAQSHQHVLQLATAVATAEGFESAAMNLCNELATRTGATRVALGWIKGQDVQVKALSHTEQFDKRQELVKVLEKAMEECIDQEEPVHFEAQGGGTQNVSRAAQELARMEGGNVVLTLPLRRRAEVVGAVTLEFPPTHRLSPQASTGLAVAVDLLAPQLFDRYQNDRWLITKVGLSAEELGKKIVGPQHTLAKMLVLAGAAAFIFICLYKPMYHVAAQFQFDPIDQRKLQVPFEGQIEDVFVQPGDLIKKGQKLLTMRTFDLQLQLNSAQDEMRKAEAEYRKDSTTEGKEADAEAAQQEIEVANTKAQYYQEQIERGVIRAPFDGVVLTGDLMDQRNAAKKQGDELFAVMAGDGLRAKLSVSERDIQYLNPGQHGLLASQSLPTEKYPFTIERIERMGETKEGDNTFTVYAHLDRTSPDWRPGVEGEARVDIERRPLVWIWTHRFFDYLKFKLWM
ncbi:MAG: HlyD family efflux transporter periplasmic adaptor subunit [Tepidisphaeraceae bacterium]